MAESKGSVYIEVKADFTSLIEQLRTLGDSACGLADKLEEKN